MNEWIDGLEIRNDAKEDKNLFGGSVHEYHWVRFIAC